MIEAYPDDGQSYTFRYTFGFAIPAVLPTLSLDLPAALSAGTQYSVFCLITRRGADVALNMLLDTTVGAGTRLSYDTGAVVADAGDHPALSIDLAHLALDLQNRAANTPVGYKMIAHENTDGVTPTDVGTVFPDVGGNVDERINLADDEQAVWSLGNTIISKGEDFDVDIGSADADADAVAVAYGNGLFGLAAGEYSFVASLLGVQGDNVPSFAIALYRVRSGIDDLQLFAGAGIRLTPQGTIDLPGSRPQSAFLYVPRMAFPAGRYYMLTICGADFVWSSFSAMLAIHKY